MDEKERGLKGYNLRKDYGELDTTASIKNDSNVIYFKPEDAIWMARFECEVIKRSKIKISRRRFISEGTYKDGAEVKKNGYLKCRLEIEANLKQKEELVIKKIVKIKKVGLVQ